MSPFFRAAAAFLLALPLLAGNPKVKVTTNQGAFVIELRPDAAPKTVENFLKYVRKGFYSGTTFHRVMRGFMIQGGGHLPNLTEKKTDSPMGLSEADLAKAKGLRNTRGTVAMALPGGNPLGAAAQFFVNLKANPNLDFKAKTLSGYGYTVFGKVVQGMEVVDRIATQKTKTQGRYENVPVSPVIIEKVEEVK